MTESRAPSIPLAAPGLTGISMLNQPVSGPRSSRRSRNKPYSHAHLEIDLDPDATGTKPAAALAGIERRLGEKDAPATANLIRLAAATLHALAARRFRRVDHWEVAPGGWLPLPYHHSRRGQGEPVGDLEAAIESDAWSSLAKARSFSVRVSDLSGNRIDVVLRRIPRLRRHALSLDLHGFWTQESVKDLEGSLAQRLPVLHTTLTKFQYA